MKRLFLFMLFILLPITPIIIGGGNDDAFGDGGKGSGGGKNSGTGTDYCSNIKETNVDILLYGSFEIPQNRVWDCPVIPNPFTSSEPASSLNDPTKYYINIKITAVDCSSYSKEYVWNKGSSIMQIKVPSEITYKVYITYYEQEGAWYSNPTEYSRTVWKFENVYYSAQDIHANNFKFSHKISKKRLILI